MIKFMGKLAAATALTLAMSAAASADEGDNNYLRVGAGYFDLLESENHDKTGEAHVEYISGTEYFYFKPFVGVMGTGDSAGYVYAGIRYDWEVTDNIIIAPSFAPGIYTDGDGKDLGHAIEFRSAIEVAYEFENEMRLGTSLYHLSNASISDRNPGVEVLAVHLSIPVGD